MAAQEVVQKHGKYYNPANEGRLFHAATAVTGVAPGTSLSTTAAFALHNPSTSGVNLVVQKVSMGYISGTLGAGTIFLAANQEPVTTAPSGTAIVPVPAGLLAVTAQGRPMTTVTVVAPTVLRPLWSLQASLASTAVAPWKMEEDIDGEIIVKPGTTLIMHGVTAAGSSPLVAFGCTWEEVAIGAD
jgi:hypothetical protein